MERPIDDAWLRDSGPIIVRGSDGARVAVHFGFNGWGGKFSPVQHDEAVGALIALKLGLACVEAPFVLEGGSIVTDGTGTLVTTERCLLNDNRNPGWDRSRIEDALRTLPRVRARRVADRRHRRRRRHRRPRRQRRARSSRRAARCSRDASIPPIPDHRDRTRQPRRPPQPRTSRSSSLPVLPYVELDGERLPVPYANLLRRQRRPHRARDRPPGRRRRASPTLAGCYPDREIVPVEGRWLAFRRRRPALHDPTGTDAMKESSPRSTTCSPLAGAHRTADSPAPARGRGAGALARPTRSSTDARSRTGSRSGPSTARRSSASRSSRSSKYFAISAEGPRHDSGSNPNHYGRVRRSRVRRRAGPAPRHVRSRIAVRTRRRRRARLQHRDLRRPQRNPGCPDPQAPHPDRRKIHEDRYFRPGDTGYPVVDVAGARFGFPTCWDQWFAELARAYSLGGARRCLVYPTAIGSEPDHPDFDTEPLWQQVIVGNGIANATFMVAVNRIGTEVGDPAVTFYGSSFISDPYGRILVQAPARRTGRPRRRSRPRPGGRLVGAVPVPTHPAPRYLRRAHRRR